MNVSEEFAELRKQFQRLHAQLDQDMLFLNVCHWPDDKSQADAAKEHCKVPFELLGLMHIPIVHPKKDKFLFVNDRLALFNESLAATNELAAATMDKLDRQQAQYQIVGFQHADQRPPRRLKVAYLRCPSETTRQIANEFRKLAQQAGATLPAVVTDAIPTFFDTNSYVDRWLEFVFWQNPPSLENLWDLNRNENTHFSSTPCDASARAIEECGLDTAIPTFKPRNGIWPVWAGIGPNTQSAAGEPAPNGAEDDDSVLLADSMKKGAPTPNKDEQLPLAPTKRRKTWPSERPPDGSRHKFGPLTGKLSQLATCADADARTLYSNNGKSYFYIRKVAGTQLEVWLDSSQTRANWNADLIASTE